MDSVHPIVSDLYATAYHQERLAEAGTIRQAQGVSRAARFGGSILAGVSTGIGSWLVRAGVRRQGASTGKAAATDRGVITGAAR